MEMPVKQCIIRYAQGRNKYKYASEYHVICDTYVLMGLHLHFQGLFLSNMTTYILILFSSFKYQTSALSADHSSATLYFTYLPFPEPIKLYL